MLLLQEDKLTTVYLVNRLSIHDDVFDPSNRHPMCISASTRVRVMPNRHTVTSSYPQSSHDQAQAVL